MLLHSRVLALLEVMSVAHLTTYALHTPFDVDAVPGNRFVRHYNETMVIPESREVSDPRIISPSSVTLWLTGTNVTVTWDTSNIPSDFDTKGKLVLGYLDGVDENEHLDIENPLADGFSLIRGYIDVLVPQVDPGSDYIVVLFGDSGNRSSTFTIL